MKDLSFVKLPDEGGALDPGWYVLVINDVIDKPAEECLELQCVVSGGSSNGRRHTFRRWYNTESDGITLNGQFNKFLLSLERSNPGKFTRDGFIAKSNERTMVGLCFGAAIQNELYTDKEGVDRIGTKVIFTLEASGVATKTINDLPPVKDKRRTAQQQQPQPTAPWQVTTTQPAPAQFSVPVPAPAPVGFSTTMTPQAQEFARQQAQTNGYVPF